MRLYASTGTGKRKMFNITVTAKFSAHARNKYKEL